MLSESNIELHPVTYVDWTNHKPADIHLVCERTEGNLLSPVRLGRGRFAQVIMGTTSERVEHGMKFLALKFLIHDEQSLSFSRNARRRYFSELSQNIRLRRFQGMDVVFFCGASRLREKDWEHLNEDLCSRPEEHAFATENLDAAEAIHAAGARNERHVDRLDPNFLKQIQSEFFVMEAEEGSLEDFLVDHRPWNRRKLFQIDVSKSEALASRVATHERQLESIVVDLASGTASKKINESDARRLSDRTGVHGRDEAPGRDCSGMAILNFVGCHAPSLRDSIAVSLWQKAAVAVGKVHQLRDESEVPLAHRDLKFGNFLYSPLATEDLVLTDFGFLSPSTEGEGTVDSVSMRETGMLALGSRLFRGPEQRDAVPPPEVRFRVLGRNVVEFFNFGDIDLQIGDRLESKDVYFGKRAKNAQYVKGKTAVVRCEERKGRIRATLEDDILDWERMRGDEDYLGFVVKISGQHSDVFALGAFLYYLASGGNNPESFSDSCLRNEFGAEVGESCLALALSLCADSPRSMIADFAAYELPDGAQQQSFFREGDFLQRTAVRWRPPVAPQPPRGNLLSIFGENVEMEESQRARYWRESPVVQRYLRDKNGTALPFPIVYEVIRCMVRGKSDSYVRAEDANKPLCEVDCGKVTTRIVARSQQLVTAAPSIKANIGDYFNGSPVSLFLNMRVAWPLPSFENGSSGDSAESLVEMELPAAASVAGMRSRDASKAGEQGKVDKRQHGAVESGRAPRNPAFTLDRPVPLSGQDQAVKRGGDHGA